jgi:hypothetical protein
MHANRHVAFIVALLAAGLAPLFASTGTRAPAEDFPGWPTHFEGRSLQALPLSDAERRFERDFPGRLGRFTDGQREIVIRWVSQPTRKLHPASDCFRGSGYRVAPMPIDIVNGEPWSRFDARREHEHWRIREAIIEDAGVERAGIDDRRRRWTDVSSWYWAAMRDSRGRRWWSFTVASSMDSVVTSTNAQFTAAD